MTDEETTTTAVAEDQQSLGHVIIDVKDMSFFTITSYKGDVNLDYLHLFAGDTTLYHKGQFEDYVDRLIMDDALNGHNMTKTIYRSDESVLSQSREARDVACESVSNLSLAVKTTHIPSKNRKVNFHYSIYHLSSSSHNDIYLLLSSVKCLNSLCFVTLMQFKISVLTCISTKFSEIYYQ